LFIVKEDMKTGKEALSAHTDIDYNDLDDYAYQHGRFTKVVYGLPNGYYCASKDSKLPQPTRGSDNKITWVEQPDNFVNSYGWKIYKADSI